MSADVANVDRSPKTVLLVAWWPVGGIRTYLKYVYRYFPPVGGYRFIVVAPGSKELTILREDLRDLPFSFVQCERSAMSMLAMVLRQARREKIDLIHAHGLTSGMYAAIVARLFRLPLLLTLHDVFRAEQFRGFWGRVKRCVGNWVFASSSIVHAVSFSAAENTVAYFPKLSRRPGVLRTILNGIEPSRMGGDEVRDVRRELGLSDQAFIIGFLGRFMSQKGFRFLVEAVQEILRDKTCARVPVVVATGSGGFVREDRDRIIALDLEAHFRFLPFTPEIAPLARGFDVVAMPSLWEAGPILPMEVLTIGVPLIGTSCIGLNDALADTPATVIPPGDARSLADALREHMSNDRKHEFRAYASKAAERFHIRRSALALKTLYDELISPSRLGC